MAGLRHIMLMLSGAAIAAGAIYIQEPARKALPAGRIQPAAETIERGAENRESLKRLRVRMGLMHMKRSLQAHEKASSALSSIGNAGEGPGGAGMIAGYEELLAGSAHDVGLAPADEKEVDSAISQAMQSKDAGSLERLASMIPQTLSAGAQSRAYRAIESLALEHVPGAGIALAQTVPFLIDEEARRDALENLGLVLEDSDGPARKAMLETLAFHLRSGPLTHWSLSADRSRVMGLLSRFE
jgi:hypothetical protein